MAKSVMYPLHTWIPEAMNAPTPVSALLHSACYVKAGVYLIARMYTVGHGRWHDALGAPLLAVGCVTILVGIIFALTQTDLKRMLAFSTISQLGFIVVGLASARRSASQRGCSIASATGCSKARCSCARAPSSMPPARATCASSAACPPPCPAPPWSGSSPPPPSSGCR